MITDDGYKRLFRFIIWLLLGILISLIGITGVFADTVIDTSTWVDISGRNWSLTGLEYSNAKTFNNEVLLNNYNVTFGVYTPPNNYDYITFSFFEHNTSVFNPCNSTSKFTATFRLLFTNPSYINYVTSVKWGNDNCSITERNTTTGWLDVSCIASPSTSNYTDIFINYNDSNGTQTSNLYITRNIDIACGLNTDAIINNDNANTQNIINNNNDNTQQIIDSSASNTQQIIDSSASNTQAIIDSNKVCNVYDNSDTIKNKTINDNGFEQSSNSVNVSDYIELSENDELYLLNNTSSIVGNFCFYNVNKTKISCTHARDISTGKITIPNNTSYFRYTISITENKPTYKICKNGNQAQNDTSKGILGKLKDLFNFFSSDEDADITGLNNMAGWLPPGPLDSIINLPLNLFQALINTLSGTCSPVTLTIPFVNQILTLPCFDTFMSQYLTGFSTLWTFVGVTCSVFILYSYLLGLYKWVDDTLTLRENNLPGYYDDNWGGGA